MRTPKRLHVSRKGGELKTQQRIPENLSAGVQGQNTAGFSIRTCTHLVGIAVRAFPGEIAHVYLSPTSPLVRCDHIQHD